MNYTALIQNRKSVRAFTDKPVCSKCIEKVRNFHDSGVHRLLPKLQTELMVFGTEAREALEGAAGYNSFLIGAPGYLVLLSEKAEGMELNAGYIMQDLILKLTDLDIGSCWLTFTDSGKVKQALGIDSPMEIAAIAAFGHSVKTTKRLRLNILSMSNIDITAKRGYFEPKKSIRQLAHVDQWGVKQNLDDRIGFFDDMLWEALYAASMAPSYLNRQAYGFVLGNGVITLVAAPDAYNTEADGLLSLGAVMLHFAAAAEQWAGRISWKLGSNGLAVPEGHRVIASAAI